MKSINVTIAPQKMCIVFVEAADSDDEFEGDTGVVLYFNIQKVVVVLKNL